MLLWQRQIPPAAGPSAQATDAVDPAAGSAAYEAKRQRALQILGERWLLHQANAPDRQPPRSVLARLRSDVSSSA